LRRKEFGLDEMGLGAVGVALEHLLDHRVGVGHPAAVGRVVDLLDGGLAGGRRIGLCQRK
jgi:hypothetical protein